MTYEPPGGPPPPPQQPWQPPPVGAPYPASAYGTPGYGYPAPAQAKPLKGLATAITVLLVLTGLCAIWLAVALFHRASVVSDFSGSFGFGRVSLQDLKDADSQVSGAVSLFGLGVIATGVLWIIWQFRFGKNAKSLRGNYGLAPGWAIGGWFVPFGNFVLPELQLFQAAKASDPDLPAGQPAAAGSVPSIVIGWWVAYDVAGLLFSLGSFTRPNDNTLDFDIDKFIRADRLSAVAALVYVAAAVLGILTVRALSERQTRAMASASAYPPGYQQPYTQAPGQPYQPPAQYPPPAPPPPQTWQTPPPNQTWQPPPPPAPPPQ